LTLIPKFGATQTNQPVEYQSNLGDGYICNTRVTGSQREEWSLLAPKLTGSEILETIALFNSLAGWVKFQWSPYPKLYPYKDYYCESWEISPVGFEMGATIWEMNCKFIEAKE
jgi:hypothetical protein